MDKKFLDYEGVSFYDDLIKEHVAEEVELTHLNDATIPDVQQLDEPYENNIDALADDVAKKVATACLSITAETVTVVVTTQVPGLSVANLTLNVIYNDNPTKIAQQPITDGNGMCSFRVPNGYTYKIIFPDRPNCHEIIPVQHTAAILQRSVEVEYVAKTQEEIDDEKGETVRVNLNDHVNMSVSNPSDITVTLKIGSTITYTQTTDSNGIAEFEINPQYYGQTYTVTVPQRENYYIRNSVYSKSYVAEKTTREINFNYREFDTGVFVVTSDGKEYDYDQWLAAITDSENPVDKSTAVFIKIATRTLLEQESQFGIKIEHIRLRTDGIGTITKQWCNQNIAFSSDLNYVSTAPYYYNGKGATQAMIEEAESKTTTLGASVTVPAASFCWNMTYTLQDEDETVCQGFLGTVYQWSVLWANRVLVDEFLDKILPIDEKPEGATYYTLDSTRTWYKRTSNQSSSNESTMTPSWQQNSYNTITGGSNPNNKVTAIQVIPFFSF